MEALVRFAIIVLAILLTPWLASFTPDISRWDSGWVQAWGSIGAILVGFGYVGLQRHWAQQDIVETRRQVRSHALSLVSSALAAVDKRLSMFETVQEKGGAVGKMGASDGISLVGQELLLVSPVDCGSAAFSMLCRQAGLYAHHFADQCHQIVEVGERLKAEEVSRLRESRDVLAEAEAGLREQL